MMEMTPDWMKKNDDRIDETLIEEVEDTVEDGMLTEEMDLSEGE